MDGDERRRFALTVTRLFTDAVTAYRTFVQEWTDWLASPFAPGFGSHIDHRTPGSQRLEVICLSHPEHLDRLGHAVANVFQPLRIAHDRVERQKRVLGLSRKDWPPTDAIWDLVRSVDNLTKHERVPPLELWLVEASVAVTRGIGLPILGEFDTNIEPLPLPVDHDGVSLFRVVSDIPKQWRGPEFWYGIASEVELRFSASLKGSQPEPVQESMARAMKTATALVAIAEGSDPADIVWPS
jgi:hypothetical protein